MRNFTFYFLYFLNFSHLILSTNPPCKFILDEMDKFQKKFGDKSEELKKKLDKIPGGEKTMGQIFMHGMFKKEFPSEILKAKEEVEKFLREEATFEDIFYELNFFKIRYDDNLDELKVHKKELENAQNHQKHLQRGMSNNHQHQSQDEKQLELVNILINLKEFTNKFIDDLTVELQIRQPIKNFIKLGKLLKEQKATFFAPFEKFLSTYSKKAFHKIENIIKLEKQALQKAYETPEPPLSQETIDIIKQNELPRTLIEIGEKLQQAFGDKNPLLEKVRLNILTEREISQLHPAYQEMLNHYVEIKKLIDNVVDELPKEIDEDFFMENQEEFANLHTEFGDLLAINIASNELYNRIGRIVDIMNRLDGLEQHSHFIYIQWLAEFIEEKLTKINQDNQGPILNMAMAKEKAELPTEMAFNGSEMDPKKMAILIAQNMLFIAAQISKKKYFDEAISAHYKMAAHPLVIVKNSNKDAIIYHFVLKKLPPKSIGQFFYQKYVEMVKKGEYVPSKAMHFEFDKIGGHEVEKKKIK